MSPNSLPSGPGLSTSIMFHGRWGPRLLAGLGAQLEGLLVAMGADVAQRGHWRQWLHPGGLTNNILQFCQFYPPHVHVQYIVKYKYQYQYLWRHCQWLGGGDEEEGEGRGGGREGHQAAWLNGLWVPVTKLPGNTKATMRPCYCYNTFTRKEYQCWIYQKWIVTTIKWSNSGQECNWQVG